MTWRSNYLSDIYLRDKYVVSYCEGSNGKDP